MIRLKNVLRNRVSEEESVQVVRNFPVRSVVLAPSCSFIKEGQALHAGVAPGCLKRTISFFFFRCGKSKVSNDYVVLLSH